MTMVSRPKTQLILLFTLIYIILSAYVVARFAIVSNFGDSWRGTRLSDMVQGTAERPYVYRVLVPWMIGAADRLMPEFVQEAAGDALMSLKTSPVITPFITDKYNLRMVFEQPELMHLRVAMLLVVTLLLAGYIVALYKLGRALFPGEWAMALFMPVLGLLLPPALAYPTMYTYDFAVLFLSTCCYYCLAAGKWRWYYVWFILACINKETSVFLLLFYSLWYFPRMETKRFITHWACQFILFVAIRGAIYHAYADNPGEFLKSDYFNWQLITLLTGYDYADVIVYCAAALLLTCGWQQKPLFARYGLSIFALMLGAFIIFGRPEEYRVFYDILPLLIVLATHTLVSYTGLARAALFQGHPT